MNRKSGAFRTLLTALLVLPVIPIGWVYGANRNIAEPSKACATGASCMKCALSNCGGTADGYRYDATGTVVYTRCVEYDHIVPGHCAAITFTNYEIFDGNWIVGTCLTSDCVSSTIYYTRPCDNPLVL